MSDPWYPAIRLTELTFQLRSQMRDLLDLLLAEKWTIKKTIKFAEIMNDIVKDYGVEVAERIYKIIDKPLNDEDLKNVKL